MSLLTPRDDADPMSKIGGRSPGEQESRAFRLLIPPHIKGKNWNLGPGHQSMQVRLISFPCFLQFEEM